MSSELVPFRMDGKLPSYLQKGADNASLNTELAGGISIGYPVLSFRGKTWSLREGGTSTIIMKEDDEDEVASSLEVVIVKANPNLSKVYYDGGYTEGSDEKPKCYSHDGHKPAADAASPQSTTCALCPHNAWGSRISENGSKGKACADSRRVAVCPGGELGRPMLLRIPAATLKDLAGYAQMLSQREAPYQAVLTKIGFDPTVAHPKLTFKVVRWLTESEFAEVLKTMNTDLVQQIIGVDAKPKAVDALPSAPAHVAETKPAPAPVAEAKPVGKTTFGKPKPAPAAEPAAEEAAPKAAKPKAPKAAKPAPAVEVATTISADLEAALAGLDDLD